MSSVLSASSVFKRKIIHGDLSQTKNPYEFNRSYVSPTRQLFVLFVFFVVEKI